MGILVPNITKILSSRDLDGRIIRILCFNLIYCVQGKGRYVLNLKWNMITLNSFISHETNLSGVKRSTVQPAQTEVVFRTKPSQCCEVAKHYHANMEVTKITTLFSLLSAHCSFLFPLLVFYSSLCHSSSHCYPPLLHFLRLSSFTVRVDSHTARHNTIRQKQACIHVYSQLTYRQNVLFSQSQRHCLCR
jgi:hypothetical protein